MLARNICRLKFLSAAHRFFKIYLYFCTLYELHIYITTFPAYLLELLPAAEAERSDGAGIADAPYEGLPQGEVGDEEILCRGSGAYSATFIVTGCSMGGFRAGNFFFRRPDLFDTLLAPDRDYVI